jgi:hypothetical protein
MAGFCFVADIPVSCPSGRKTLTVSAPSVGKHVKDMENWLETDETQEAVLALQLVSEQLAHLESGGNPHYWPWIIVGLHNTLQGFMVLALRGTNNINVLTEDCAREWLAAYARKDGTYPEQKLDKFLNLYKKIKSSRMQMYVNSQVFKPNSTQGRSIKKLNSLRNDFVHFVPKGWAIDLSGLPQIVDDCLNVISFLAFDCGNVIWHDRVLETQTSVLLEKVKQNICLVRKAYGG